MARHPRRRSGSADGPLARRLGVARARAGLSLALALAAVGCGDEAPKPVQAAAGPPPFARAHPLGERPPARGERRLRAGAPRKRHAIARFTRSVVTYARPGGPVLRRLGRRTEFGSPRAAAVVRRTPGWLGVAVPERPNGALAWVRAGDVRLSGTDVSIAVDLSDRELTLRRGHRVLRRVTVAIGQPAHPTPTGRFGVTDRLHPERPDSPYGCCAIALTGHQTKLRPGWPGGDRLAIHGTPATHTIGQAVSLGCMRASRRDLEALMRRVPLGAPVTIRR